ncbi:MAG TPA: secretin N-terminal domain-containing protein [Burkholderiales bacterium]|jgi:general secretion pathway protein D
MSRRNNLLGLARTALVAAAVCLLGGCVNPVFKEGRTLADEGRYDEALPKLAQLAKDNPEEREYRAYYFRQRELAVAQANGAADAARQASDLAKAEEWYRKALGYDPDNARARAGISELAIRRRQDEMLKRAGEMVAHSDINGAESIARTVLAQDPGSLKARAILRTVDTARAAADGGSPTSVNSPFKRPVTLEFREAPIRSVFEAMSRVAGINFVFDKDVKPDTRITIFVRNTSIDEVMRLILTTNQLERKVLNDSSVLIYPNLPAKVREYQDLVVRTFYLVNADAKQVQAMVRTMAKTRDMYVDEKLNALIVRDTPEAVRLVEKLVAAVDLPEPEVMLEIEVMEIASTRAQALGLEWPSQVQYGVPNITGQVPIRGPGNGMVGTIANPALIADLHTNVTGTNTLANPRIRVRNHEKAKVHIGDKLPVFTTTATANVGVSASVTYLDVGLKLEIEPNVYLDNEVAIKLGLEVSSVTNTITGPSGSIAYQIGTRLTNTVLRLHDGETQILAGLINDEDRMSGGGIPGLGDLPILGRLFSSKTDTRNKTEVVLLITPRVLRNVVPPESATVAQDGGTEAQFGAAPLRLKMTGPGSLNLSSSQGAAGAAAGSVGGSQFSSIQQRRRAAATARGEVAPAAEAPANPAPEVAAPVTPPTAPPAPVPTPPAAPAPAQPPATLQMPSTSVPGFSDLGTSPTIPPAAPADAGAQAAPPPTIVNPP